MDESEQAVSRRDVIQRCRLFSGLGPDDIDRLHAMSVDNWFERGQTIFTQGDACPGLFIVVSGQIRITRNGVNGKTHVLHVCGPGETFAEVAVFANILLPADATASKAARCICLPTLPLQTALDESHQMCRQLLVGLSLWTRHFVELLDDLILQTSKGRIARYLCNLPADREGRVRLPVSQKEAANHLNLTSETFSRVLRSFAELGIIQQTSTREFRVLENEKLLSIELQSANKASAGN